jgi:hypothetical protein
MLNHRQAVLALRRHLLALQFVTTGTVPLASTGTGFTRTDGSFIADGFTVGMEVVPTGFADSTPGIVEGVTATEIIVKAPRQAEPTKNASLSVGIPTVRIWENQGGDPQSNRWYLEEDYIPGPTTKITMPVQGAELHHSPTYVLRVGGMSGYGIGAILAVVGGLLGAFYPGLALILPNNVVLRVGAQPAPYAGQMLSDDTGRPVVVVTFPLWARTSISV